MPKRAALYVRVSTAQQAAEDRWSLPAQRRALRDECDRTGWDIAEVFEDAGISGETLERRPSMMRMLDGMRAGEFDVVLAVEFERFSRSRHGRDWAEIMTAAEEGRAAIAVPGQVLDPARPDDGFLAGLFGLLSARENAKRAQRTARGIRERTLSGRWWGAQRPYGYVVGDDGRLEIHAEEARIVRRVFSSARAGETFTGVAKALNLDAVPTPRGGKEWRASTVRAILENPVHAGRLAYGRSVDRPRGGERVVVEDAHPAIIPPHEFDHYQTLRVARKRSRMPTSNWSRGYILTGLLQCPWCGGRMCGGGSGKPSAKNPKPKRYYGHPKFGRDLGCRKVRADSIERAVIEQVVAALSAKGVEESVRRALVEERCAEGTEELRERSELEASLAAEERRISALYDDRLAGAISPTQFKAWNAESLDRQQGVRDRLRALEDRLLSLGRHADVDLVVGHLGDLASLIGTLEPAELKRLMVELVREVRYDVESEAVSVEFRLPGISSVPQPRLSAREARVAR